MSEQQINLLQSLIDKSQRETEAIKDNVLNLRDLVRREGVYQAWINPDTGYQCEIIRSSTAFANRYITDTIRYFTSSFIEIQTIHWLCCIRFASSSLLSQHPLAQHFQIYQTRDFNSMPLCIYDGGGGGGGNNRCKLDMLKHDTFGSVLGMNFIDIETIRNLKDGKLFISLDSGNSVCSFEEFQNTYRSPTPLIYRDKAFVIDLSNKMAEKLYSLSDYKYKCYR